jgi:bifunctional ADP-heptose synthase (sugar kinase/adenylyltransferase)
MFPGKKKYLLTSSPQSPRKQLIFACQFFLLIPLKFSFFVPNLVHSILLDMNHISKNLQERLYEQIISALDRVDVMIFSDFNYGCLPQELVDRAIVAGKKKNVMLLADSQSSSQTGDIGRFNGMKLITPTEREARLAMRDTESGLVVLAERLRQQSRAENIFLKLGAEGLLVHAHNSSENDWITDRVDALNSAPKDVAGAGDSMLVAAALTLAAGGGIWEAA